MTDDPDSEAVRAFVPGHVTGFFSVHRHGSPERTGSRGAGLALSDGVTVAVEPAAETTVELDGRPVEMGAVEGVLDRLDASARVSATTPLPLSAGFGVSGATALGTALAANALVDGARTENELVAVAHAAEVTAGTGLGDVVAQARGGVPVRTEPGAPPHGRLDAVPARPRVEYVTFGELATESVIEGEVDRLSAAGEAALERLLERPTLDRLLECSRSFAREAGLVTDPVAAAVADVAAAGGTAAMAMLGETVFALGTGLTDAGYDARSCAVHPPGATLAADDRE